jgi:lipopolysaccharide/colanic/teichoic acid biosynthesis glycosyltransferase
MREACVFVRPGITGPATLKYRDEESLLAEQDDPEKYNDEILWPDKVRLNREYVEDWSFLGDLRYIWETVFGEGKGERAEGRGRRDGGKKELNVDS